MSHIRLNQIMHLRWNHGLNFPQQWIKYSWRQEYTLLFHGSNNSCTASRSSCRQTEWQLGGMYYCCATTVTFSNNGDLQHRNRTCSHPQMTTVGIPGGIPNPLYEHQARGQMMYTSWYVTGTVVSLSPAPSRSGSTWCIASPYIRCCRK
jgi:hypothetical protein